MIERSSATRLRAISLPAIGVAAMLWAGAALIGVQVSTSALNS